MDKNNWKDLFVIENPTEEEKEFNRAIRNHEAPVCPKCGKGKIVCPHGKIEKPHYFECTNKCGWRLHIDYVLDDEFRRLLSGENNVK